MNTVSDNPFHELFVTDSASPEDFIRYFSPYLVPHMLELFREGNVILKGTQGCGKSMLLKLFQPEIRIAYAAQRATGIETPDFPVPAELRNFIGAGVNLSKSGLLDIAQMLTEKPRQPEIQQLTALFTDFLNYWLLRDFIRSLKLIAENANVFNNLVDSDKFDSFVRAVREDDCWFGYLESCTTLGDLERRVGERVLCYRRWLARNDDQLERKILQTKTAIGEPLSKTVECLKITGVIGQRIPVFLRIDQMEELWHREGYQAILSQHFRQVINRVIGNRDLRVSFRIGTRRYSWDDELSMPGGRKIEEHRDYVVVDLDKKLRRKEDRGGWLFEGFAADVFSHRLSSVRMDATVTRSTVSRALLDFFGPSPTPQELVEHLIVVPPDDPQKLLKLDDEWSEEWKQYIFAIYEKRYRQEALAKKSGLISEGNYPRDPLNALLLVAWGLQTGGGTSKLQRKLKPPPESFPPWTKWWVKERSMLAVMQLVVRHQQTLFWWGASKILALSSSNITLFLSICREIWDQWLRRTQEKAKMPRAAATLKSSPTIGWKIQAVAIDNVSNSWHRNFARQPGRPGGDVRIRFVDQLANWLRREMLRDTAMSYPGGNGFSLRQSDLEANAGLEALLAEAVGWGDLYEVEHTTKMSQEKHRNPRRKYYLNPILSPHFQISDAHTKEPIYAKVKKILELAIKSNALLGTRKQDSASDLQQEVSL